MGNERQGEARRYASIQRKLYLIDVIVGAALGLLLVFSGAAVGLRDALEAVSQTQALLVALTSAVLSAGYVCLLFPLTLWRSHRLPKRFGLSVQTFSAWAFDWLKGVGIGLVLMLVVVEVVYFFLSAFPSVWWLLAGGAMLLFTVVLANLAPIVFLPLFYKLVPLADEELSSRLVSLAERAGARVRGVFTMDMSAKTTAANAALMGLGNTRRIVLGDTLLANYSADEIETVLAHELGHHVHADIPKGIVVQSLLTLATFYVMDVALSWGVARFGYVGVADVAAMPLLALVVGACGLAAMPIGNAWSRYVEGQADQYALECTGRSAAFASAMAKLADQNLSELSPPQWVEFLLYDHPATGRRIAKANQWASSQESN